MPGYGGWPLRPPGQHQRQVRRPVAVLAHVRPRELGRGKVARFEAELGRGSSSRVGEDGDEPLLDHRVSLRAGSDASRERGAGC